MSLKQNTPLIYDRFREQTNKPPSVEDGNPPDASNQGKIFTSELSPADGYSVDYSATIVTVTPAILSGTKGNNYTYEIVITYSITLQSGATVPGYYGDNFLDAGDPFIIETNNVVRGTVNSIVSAPPPTIIGSVYTYTLTMNCTLTEGDPLSVSAGSVFRWKLNLYNEESNFSAAYPPVDLVSNYNNTTGEVFFYWKNINENSYTYNLQIRELGVFPPTTLEYIYVPGNTPNPATALTPFVTPAGTISTIRIDKAGEDCNSERTIEFIGPGTGSSWATRLDPHGSLLINDFQVYQIISGGSNINIYSTETKKGYTDYPTPTVGSYLHGLPAVTGVSGGTHFYINSVTQINPGSNRYLQLSVRNAETGSPVVFPVGYTAGSITGGQIFTHDGVYRLSSGTGYNSRLRARVKTIPPNVKYYYDPAIHTTIQPNQTYAWNVSANLDEINKLYTEWTEEQQIQT